MFNFRLLDKNDFDKKFLSLLSQLTLVGQVSKNNFLKQFKIINSNPFHFIYVLEDNNLIISSGTLLIEPKFIHNTGYVGHIEDIVVDQKYRGKNIGKKLILFLTDIAKKHGCYKVLLNCSDNKIGFYEKCLFYKNSISMAKYNK